MIFRKDHDIYKLIDSFDYERCKNVIEIYKENVNEINI